MFLNGALRQCKSLSAYQRYFSLKTLKQRWPAQCVKPITRRKNDRLPTVIMLLHSVPFISPCKSFVAQIPATSKFPAMQRNDGRGPDEIRSINFELNVAPHASGSVLVSMGQTRVICGVTIEEGVPRWMKEQGVHWRLAYG